MSEDVSKPTTKRTKKDRENYEKGWKRIFGKKKKVK